MQSVLESLSRAIEGAPVLALLASLTWGALSILLSPCHLASIPLIVACISSQTDSRPRTAFWTSLSFAVGLLLSIALIGVATSLAGRMLGDLGGWVNYAVAVVFFLVGLHLLGVFEMPFAAHGFGAKQKGYRAAFTLGAVFGIALGPCTFAFMAPVLATALKVGASSPVFAAGLVLAYGLGHCSVIVGAGSSAQAAQKLLSWGSAGDGAIRLKRIAGVLVILGGLYLLYSAR